MIPELKVKTGSFTRPTGTGEQEITGVGFQPKVILLYGCQQTGVGDGADVRFSFGGAASDLTQASASYALANGSAYWTSKVVDGATVYGAYENLGGSYEVEGFAALTEMTPDGFVIEWGAVDGAEPVIVYIAFGGDAVIAATCGSAFMPTSTQTTTYFCGFVPDTVFLFGANAQQGGTTQEVSFFTGFGRTFGGGVTGHFINSTVDEAVAPSNTWRHMRNSTAYSIVNSNTGAAQRLGTFSGAGQQGFRIFHSPVTANSDSICWVAIKGVQAYLNASTQPTSPQTHSLGVVGFLPQLVMLSGVVNTNFLAPRAEMRATRGFYDGTNHFCFFQGSTDNQTPPVSREDYSTTKVIRHLTEGVSGVTVNAQASVQSLDANGFTLNWDTTDTTVRVYTYAALAPVPTFFGTFLPQAPGQYHLASRRWTFDASEEDWVLSQGYWDAAAGNPGGGIYNVGFSSGKGVSRYIGGTWSGTFEDLGVPAGATVECAVGGTDEGIYTSVDAAGMGATIRIQQYDLNDEFGNLYQRLIDSQSLTSRYKSYVGVDESNLPSLLLPSNTPIQLYIYMYSNVPRLQIGTAELKLDNISIVLRYRW